MCLQAIIRIVLTSLLGCFAARGSDFDEANRKYDAGDHAGAAAAYERLLASEGPRVSLYYNLGNCHLQLKQYGPAILSYERALVIAPRDPDVRANLLRARKAAAAFEEPARFSWLQVASQRLSRNEWAWLLSTSALMLGLIACLAGSASMPRRVLRFFLHASALLGVIAVISASVLYLRRGESSRAIVLSGEAVVRLSPFNEAAPLGSPGPGRVVKLGVASGDFRFIEVPGTDLKGWIAASDVAAVSH